MTEPDERTAACVQACAGMMTETLDSGAMMVEMVAILAQLADAITMREVDNGVAAAEAYLKKIGLRR